MNYLKKCPIVNDGKCRFSRELLGESFSKPQIFYAFESVADVNQSNYTLQRYVKKSVELITKELNVDFIAFDTAEVEGLDWFCNKVCFHIQNSAMLIADISNYNDSTKHTINSNVAFEVGLALGFGIKVLLINSTPDNLIPSDFKIFEIFEFEKDFLDGRFKNTIISYLENQNLSSGFELISNKSIYTKKIIEIESIKADWLLASDYHSFLFRPIEGLRNLAKKNSSDENDYKKRKAFIEKRWNNFRNLLKEDNNLKFYHIYEIKGISDYFSTGLERRKTSPNSIFVESKQLIDEIKEAKSLLNEFYPKLQIAFTNRIMPYAFLVRPKHVSIIDSKSDLPDTLNAIIASYKGVVEEMENNFYIYWNEIPHENKTKDFCLKFYDELENKIIKQDKE